MRQIKFRGKRLDNGEWVYGDLVENQGRFFIYHATSETTIEDNDNHRITVMAVEIAPDTVGQFTGLLDKNGKEIYEDDIVQADYITTMGSHRIGLPVEVRWCNQEARWVGWDGYTEVGLISPQKLVVKGNLFYNTELM